MIFEKIHLIYPPIGGKPAHTQFGHVISDLAIKVTRKTC